MKSSLQWRVFQLGIVFGVIIYLVNLISETFFSSLYADIDSSLLANISPLWKLATYFVTGLLFALGYSIFYSGVPGRGIHKGLQYGFWIWMVGAIPVIFLILATFALPVEVIVGWIVLGLSISVILGFLVGWLYRPNKS